MDWFKGFKVVCIIFCNGQHFANGLLCSFGLHVFFPTVKVAAFSVCFTVVSHAHVPIERGVLSMFLSIQFRDIITMMTSRPILEMQAILDFFGQDTIHAAYSDKWCKSATSFFLCLVQDDPILAWSTKKPFVCLVVDTPSLNHHLDVHPSITRMATRAFSHLPTGTHNYSKVCFVP